MTHRPELPQHLRRLGAAGLFALGLAGCRHNQAQTATTQNTDPAAANMAQPYTGGDAGGYGSGSTQVLGQSQNYAGQASAESYETQAPAPIIRRAPTAATPAQNTTYYPVPQAQAGQPQTSEAQYQGDPNQPYNGPYDDAEQAGEDAVIAADQAPPPLPEYDQPPAPADDYEWTPGYWNYASAGYYWVPGAWVAPPFYGALWTPPYWGYAGDRWHLHRGYWGPHVGYYGGIDYGFGYIGTGYFGGYWNDRHFFYNRAVTNVNINNVHNVYNRTVVYNNITYGPHSSDRVSYNGGRGGVDAQPRPQELTAMHETHFAATAVQVQHRAAAAGNRGQFFADNHGRPAQAFAGHPVGNVGNVSAPPRSFLEARAGQPGSAAPNRFGAAAPGGNNGPNRNANAPEAGRVDARTAFSQPGNRDRVAPPANPAAMDHLNRPAVSAPANTYNNRFGNAQPGAAPPNARLETNAAHLPTPEAPRTQINGNGINGSYNRPQTVQQRPELQQRPEPQQRQEIQQRPEPQQRPEVQQRSQFGQGTPQRPQAQQVPQRSYQQPQVQQRQEFQQRAEPQSAQPRPQAEPRMQAEPRAQAPQARPEAAPRAAAAPRPAAEPAHNGSPHNR